MPRLCTLLLLMVLPLPGRAGDWPQWLGPNRDGSTSEKVAPWKGPLKVLWRQSVGEGNSAPVVAGAKVFLHAKVRDKDQEEVQAFDAMTGKPAWQSAYDRVAFKSLFGNGPRATPAVDGDRLYTFGITGILTCWETGSGRQIWQVDTLKEFQTKNLFFGMSCSPLVDRSRVLVNVGGKGASIVAFDKAKGEAAWKSQDDRASYSSPILVGEGDGRQAIFLTQQGLVSLNPADGALYWRFPFVDKLFESSTTPIRAGDMLLASSITLGSVGLQMDKKDGRPDATQAWKNEALTSYFSTPVPVGDHIYLVSGTKPPARLNEARLHCIETGTGKETWSKPRRVGKYHASLVRTGDNKLLMLEEPGDLVLLEPDPKEYRELARSKACGETWAHPALADGKLYVRDNKELVCIQFASGD